MNGWMEAVRQYLSGLANRPSEPLVTTFTARLESSQRGAYFLASFEAVWPPPEPSDLGLQSLAQLQLLFAAQAVAKSYSVLDPDETSSAINLELCHHLCLEEPHVQLRGASVTALWADKADRDLAERRAALLRETEVARAEQAEKLERLRILGDHVLANPMLARLWWLNNQPDKLPQLVEMKTVFEEAAALFSPRAEQPTADPVPRLIQSFLHGLTTDQRVQLIDQLSVVFRAYERTDLGDELRTYQPTPAPGPDGETPNGRGPVPRES